MLPTDTEETWSSTNVLDANEVLYRSDVSTVTMAETPTHQPITAFSLALRHSLCSHADYLYFSDTVLSKCVQKPNHIQHQQVGLTIFLISAVVVCYLWHWLLDSVPGRTRGFSVGNYLYRKFLFFTLVAYLKFDGRSFTVTNPVDCDCIIKWNCWISRDSTCLVSGD